MLCNFLERSHVFNSIVSKFTIYMGVKMKATVDQDGCISCGVCVSVCPDVFSFNDNDVSEAIEGDIPSDSIEAAKEARDSCPVSVISIED